MKSAAIITLLVLFSPLCCFSEADFNPYQILNVPQTAETPDIRKAYKQLVREWHPDKNSAPDAQDKFIKIQQAYEILSDDEKRRQYDDQGFPLNGNQWKQQWQTYDQGFHFSDDFGGFDFSEDHSHRSVSYHTFVKKILPESHHTPQVLYIYSTFCAQCIVILKSTWEKAATDLEKLGVGVGTVDTTFSSRLASVLRVSRIPATVVVYQEQYSYFRGVISYQNLKNFVNEQLPNHLVTMVTESTFPVFMRDMDHDDKPRALLVSSQPNPTLLYTLMATKHHEFIKFGFVSRGDNQGQKLAARFHVTGTGPCLLLFKEGAEKPSVTLQSSEMPRGAVNDLLTSNHYRMVPRLVSPKVFNDVCPPSNEGAYNIQYCAILVVNQAGEALERLRQMVSAAAHEDEQLVDWIKFVYVLAPAQEHFVKSIRSSEEAPTSNELYLTWRRSEKKGKLTQVSATFLDSDNKVVYGFQKFLALALKTHQQHRFEKDVTFSPLLDELQSGVIWRCLRLTKKYAVILINALLKLSEQELMLLVIITVILLLSLQTKLTSSGKTSSRSRQPQHNFVSSDDEDDVEVHVSYDDEEEDDAGGGDKLTDTDIGMIELDPSSYEELILCQKRGHMTIVFLTTKPQHGMSDDLVTCDFLDVMRVHVRSSRFHITFLDVSKFLSWYLELRRTSSALPPTQQGGAEHQDDLSYLHSNGRAMLENDLERSLSCHDAHGIVLAVNGSKHWYCMFIPRQGRSFQLSNVFKPVAPPPDPEPHNGACGADVFAGETQPQWQSADSNTKHGPTVISAPLKGVGYGNALTQWMDRMCEGQMPRLYVRQWPGLYVRTSDDEEEE